MTNYKGEEGVGEGRPILNGHPASDQPQRIMMINYDTLLLKNK